MVYDYIVREMDNCFSFLTHYIFSKLNHFSPCCGINLQKATKVVALLDATLAITWIIYLSIIFSQNWKDSDSSSSVSLAFWGCYLFKLVITVFLSIFLYHATSTNNVRKCRVWLIFTSLLFAIGIITLIFHWNNNSSFANNGIMVLFVVIFGIYRVCTILVVIEFIRQTQLRRRSIACQRNLTNREVEAFFKGNFKSIPAPSSNISKAQKWEHLPYNTCFEVSMDNLQIDKENPLEKTTGDLLLKGSLRLPDKSLILVAVKTPAENVDIDYFKARLAELKIMTYICSVELNENLVNLIGAVTVNIKEKCLYTIVEFCPFGNLLDYLKTHRGYFINLVKDGTISKDYAIKHYCNVRQPVLQNSMMSTFDLFKWCADICNGLKFLESIGIVHADICARNVYLSEEKVAKLSMPALPRQLYLYSTQDKSTENPLPWRWMSVESLRDMTFTTKSDVWEFGITVYEIFTLGALPFSGISWSPDFVNYLTRGLRMNKPNFATNEVYQIVLECWDNDPIQRPNVTTLCNFFADILHKYNIVGLNDVNNAAAEDNVSTDSSCVPSPSGSC